MKVSDVCNSVARVDLTDPDDTSKFDWGSGFWATDGSKVRFVTAAHLMRDFSQTKVATVEYQLPGKTSALLQRQATIMPGGDMLLFEIDCPDDATAFTIWKPVRDSRVLVAAVGYGNSLNDRSHLLEPHVMLGRGRIDTVEIVAGLEFAHVTMMIETGFSGGPLFIASDTSGDDATKVPELVAHTLQRPEVIGFCSGVAASNPDRVTFQTLSLF